jgi:hypothetical protein
MKAIVGLVVAGVLVFGSGCATKQDWIDRTLVTVDVTGSWYGSMGSGSRMGTPSEIYLELAQKGQTVTGFIRVKPEQALTAPNGPIDGTVTGDVFRFRDARGNVEAELTVGGDEMNGQLSSLGPISLRRVEPSSPPGSPPR